MAEKLNTGEVIIRKATVEDMILVAEMTQELANFQNMPTGPKLSAKELRRDCFESRWPHFQCKIAELQITKTVIGFAVYFPTYSTWEGKAMMLQNLFVKESYRGRGVGRMLFCSVASEAVASGCVRLDLHVLAWNEARFLYEVIGAENLTESQGVCYYMLSGKAFNSFSRKMNDMNKGG